MGTKVTGKNILVSGGTSGLGKAIAIRLKDTANHVCALGVSRFENCLSDVEYDVCDYSSLKSVLSFVELVAKQKKKIDILFNNAGILSPPVFSETVDGFEKSYQVNFLAHVLLTRLLLKFDVLRNPIVINTSSPIQARGKLEGNVSGNTEYSVMQAYASSKLYQALFSEKLAGEGIKGFAFDPGTFSSGIYRSQNKWFHTMYRIAAPFMVSADKVAASLVSILQADQYINGTIINKRGRSRSINRYDEKEKRHFWETIDQQLYHYLN